MVKVRVDENVKEKLKQFLEDSEEWSKQSEFVNQAIREKLEDERSHDIDLTMEEIKMLKNLAKKESDK
jgi:Arc/MetJ-type ribon-helix-helix transcriptional regulator